MPAGSHSKFSHPVLFTWEGTLTIASVAANTVATQTITLPTGIKFPDMPNSDASKGPILKLVLPNLQASLLFSNEFVINDSSFAKFKVTFFNNTAGALTPTGTQAKLVLF